MQLYLYEWYTKEKSSKLEIYWRNLSGQKWYPFGKAALKKEL